MIEDADLIFDNDSKRYYFTEDYVYNKLATDLRAALYDGLDTNPATLPKRTIEYACDQLYDFIEHNAISAKSALYAVTQNKEYHDAMKKALQYQLFYFAQLGEVAQEIGHAMSDTVSSRAIQLLHAKGLFHLIVPHIPEEW